MTLLDPHFSPPQLSLLIVRGATCGDAVRIHGAVFAALDLHSRTVAQRDVFAPALEALLRVNPIAAAGAARVIRAHLDSVDAVPAAA